MPIYSPWGYIEEQKVLVPKKLYFVMTAGHGGYMVNGYFAREHLSAAARKRALIYVNDWYCYEEDCLYAIVEWELPMYCETPDAFTNDEYRKMLLSTLTYYNHEYLKERGIDYEPTAWQRVCEQVQHDRDKREGSADAITCAWGDWHENVPRGTVMVHTADKKYHLVSSYSGWPCPRLSKCAVVKSDVEFYEGGAK